MIFGVRGWKCYKTNEYLKRKSTQAGYLILKNSPTQVKEQVISFGQKKAKSLSENVIMKVVLLLGSLLFGNLLSQLH